MKKKSEELLYVQKKMERRDVLIVLLSAHLFLTIISIVYITDATARSELACAIVFGNAIWLMLEMLFFGIFTHVLSTKADAHWAYLVEFRQKNLSNEIRN